MSELIAFLVVIGILVFVHELGHFLAARWTGMRADVFAVGMGPRLLGWNRHNGFTFGPLPAGLDLGSDTDYRICMFPIGGYVKIIGMVDESFDTEFANRPPEPYEFRSKNALQKAFVLSAGVLMNMLLAVVVFFGLTLAKGKDDLKTTTIGYVEPGSLAAQIGLQSGDKVEAVNGVPCSTWDGVISALTTRRTADTTVLDIVRNNQRIVRSVTETEVIAAMAGGGLGLQPSGMKVELGDIVSYGPADKAGLKTGDVILAADSTPVLALTQLQQYIRSHAGQTVTLHVERADTVLPVSVTVGKDSVIQVALSVRYAGTTIHTDYSIPQAAAMAVEEVAGTVALIWTSVSHIITGTVSAKQSIGGPIKIARMASRSQDAGLDVFARFLALISISLAVMNLLPLPGLDGGHLMFVGIEAIIRREIPTKVKIRVQQAGLLLLLVLMAYVFYLDLS